MQCILPSSGSPPLSSQPAFCLPPLTVCVLCPPVTGPPGCESSTWWMPAQLLDTQTGQHNFFIEIVKYKLFVFYHQRKSHICVYVCVCVLWSSEPVCQTLNSPDVWAASAAILHKLTAVIQFDSKRLHSSSLSLVFGEENGYTIRAGLPLRCESLPVQRSSADVPLSADCWWVAGMNLPLRRSFSPRRPNIFSGRWSVHKQPVKEFRTDVIIYFFSNVGLLSSQFLES